MFTQSILPASGGMTPAPSASTSLAAMGFKEALAAAQEPAATGKAAPSSLATVSAPAAPVDPVDEEKALQELFHILACLSVGIVDYPKDSAASEGTSGPMRQQVEALKEVLRRIMNGSTRSSTHKGSGTKGEEFADLSLDALLQSLPPEIRNLLMRAFPKLKDLLREEAEAKVS